MGTNWLSRSPMRVWESFSRTLCGFSILATSITLSAWAGPAESSAGSAKPCGVLQKFEGEVQILDPNRTTLLETQPNAFIPCGGWVSVRRGNAVIQHRQKYEIYLGSQTFVEVFDRFEKERTADEQLVIYRGHAFVTVPKGSDEFWALTATGRVRVESGTAILSYFKERERTQLMAIEGTAQFYNRYEMSRSVPVQPGEISGLDMDSLRVVPETPKAVPVAGLRETLAEFVLDRKWIDTALRMARARGERRFATGFNKSAQQAKIAKSKGGSDRAPAGMVWQNENAPDPATALSAPKVVSKKTRGPSPSEMAAHLVGSEAEAGMVQSLLHPAKDGGRRKPQAVAQGEAEAKAATESEKRARKKLIQDLQAIQPED
jgi:hypothetical protein